MPGDPGHSWFGGGFNSRPQLIESIKTRMKDIGFVERIEIYDNYIEEWIGQLFLDNYIDQQVGLMTRNYRLSCDIGVELEDKGIKNE